MSDTDYKYEWLKLEPGQKIDLTLEKVEIVDKGQPHNQPNLPQWQLGRFHRHTFTEGYIFDRKKDSGFSKKVREIVEANGELPCKIRIFRLADKGWYLAQFPPEVEEEIRTPDFIKELGGTNI